MKNVNFAIIFTMIIINMFFIFGCSKNKENDFIEVCRITYSINNNYKTLNSEYIVETELFSEDATLEEYSNAEYPYKCANLDDATSFKLDKNRNFRNPHFENGKYIYFERGYGTGYNIGYAKIKILNQYIKYVYVKIIDLDTIVIKQGTNGVETICNINTYSILYFTN